jgi:phosphinothricin acetyltransferase
VIIRPSTAADIPAITQLYGHYVRHSTATFEEVPPDEEEMLARRVQVLEQGLPHLVVEADREVAGCAWATPWRARPAYRFAAEDSVYLRPEMHRRGLGRALLMRIVGDCQSSGRRQLIAVVGDSTNAASIGLHESLGFRRVGVLQNIGWKFDRWIDTVLLQRELS